MLDTDIKFTKYHYYYCRFTCFKDKNTLHWDVINEHDHDGDDLEAAIDRADKAGQTVMIPWLKDKNEYGMDFMSKSKDKIENIRQGFSLSLSFDATFNKMYPIWQQKMEADRRETQSNMD